MGWSWDSTAITHDQTCWTYDGYNGCVTISPPAGGGGRQITFTPYSREDPVDYEKQNEMILDIVYRMLTGGIL